MVHQTRALATVIDKRTYCQFDFVPAAAAAAAAGAALTVTLCIQTKQLDEKYEWNYDELHEKAQTMQSQCTTTQQNGISTCVIAYHLSAQHPNASPACSCCLCFVALCVS